MGQHRRRSCFGTFLAWSMMITPLIIINVAFVQFAHGFPMIINSSAAGIQNFAFSNQHIDPTPDDLALSSEEELEDEQSDVIYPADNDEKTLQTPFTSQEEEAYQRSPYADYLKSLTGQGQGEGHEEVKTASLGNDSDTASPSNDVDGNEGVSHSHSHLHLLAAQNDSSAYRHGRTYNAPPDAMLVTSSSRDIMDATEKIPTLVTESANSSNENVSSSTMGVDPKVEEMTASDDVKVVGLSIDYDSDKRRVEYNKEGSPVILEGLQVSLRMYGRFTPDTFFRFSKFHSCNDPMNMEPTYKVEILPSGENLVGIVDVKIPEAGEFNEVYLCVKSSESALFRRQGETGTENFGLPIQPWLVIKLTKSMFPFYIHVVFIVVLLILSGLFSGLNLGLMSLDKTDLKIIVNTGSKSEKQYAQSIAPVRDHGNFLLCCLLFSNVLVNATLTILVDDLTSGLVAIAGSTLAIVIFGEIIPQAICSRYGLAVGAKTIYITKFFMVLTAPLAYPLSKVLDKVLGEEIGNIYTRERLKELLKVTKDHHGLETEEVGIISGALDLKLKTVKDVMIRLEQIFMLPADTILDFETMAEIEFQGYSRIPVYDGERSNVVALINVRQLTLLDASDSIPLRTVMDYYKTNLFFVFENTHLDFMFKAFREGSRGHMAFVQRVNDEGPGDPYYETVGMLTMEDVLEEILQADIRDENDVGKLNARSGNQKRPAPIPFVRPKPKKKVVEVPATLALAATQFLSTSVEPFKYGTISVHIIQRLLKTNVQFLKAPKRKGRQQMQEVFLFENGKSADCFIMILEGRVHVTVGKERLMYEAGPFTVFGVDFLLNDSLALPLRLMTAGESSLSSPTELDPSERPSITSDMADLKRCPTFIPDYSVKVLTDAYFLRLRHDQYRHALAATELEKAYYNDPEKANGNHEWQDEIEKVMGNDEGDEDDEKDEEKLDKVDSIDTQKNPNILVNGVIDQRPPNDGDKETSTSTETDESDNNKDSDEDGNHPTEVTKLLQANAAYS